MELVRGKTLRATYYSNLHYCYYNFKYKIIIYLNLRQIYNITRNIYCCAKQAEGSIPGRWGAGKSYRECFITRGTWILSFDT
jgi:hypothetical protein